MHLIRRQSTLSPFSSQFYITLNIPVGLARVLPNSEVSVLFNSRIRSLAETVNWRSLRSHVLVKYFGVAMITDSACLVQATKA